MNQASLDYLVDLQKKVYTLYDAEELQTLCFMLGVDYDSLRGNAKQTKVNSLILRMARTGRLEDLVDQASQDRTHVEWYDRRRGWNCRILWKTAPWPRRIMSTPVAGRSSRDR
ncbi:MAG: hypothetical protein R3C44_14840 [Chloroflexota bacterium]